MEWNFALLAADVAPVISYSDGALPARWRIVVAGRPGFAIVNMRWDQWRSGVRRAVHLGHATASNCHSSWGPRLPGKTLLCWLAATGQTLPKRVGPYASGGGASPTQGSEPGRMTIRSSVGPSRGGVKLPMHI